MKRACSFPFFPPPEPDFSKAFQLFQRCKGSPQPAELALLFRYCHSNTLQKVLSRLGASRGVFNKTFLSHYLVASSGPLEAAVWVTFMTGWSRERIIILEPDNSALWWHHRLRPGQEQPVWRSDTALWCQQSEQEAPSPPPAIYKSSSTVLAFRIIWGWHNLYSLKDLITHIAHLTFKKAGRKCANGFWLINI